MERLSASMLRITDDLRGNGIVIGIIFIISSTIEFVDNNRSTYYHDADKSDSDTYNR
jgi:hypothetical protein